MNAQLAPRLGALVLGLAAALAACGSDARPPRPTNVLMVAIDTLRADHLGGYGYGRATSPSIDALLTESIVFDNAHSTAPWTLPSFATLLTSQYTSTHGCWKFDSALGEDATTLAEVLRAAGFRTAGVSSHVFLRAERGLAQGFDEWDQTLARPAVESHEAISSPGVTERALEFLEGLAGADDPWFLWVHYFDPHAVYQHHSGVTEAFGERAIDRYDGEIAFTDQHVGALLERLEALGAARDTIVVLVADHGEEFGDHGGRGHGLTLFHEVVRLPLALRVPGLAPGRVDATVGSIDVMPTLLELLGVDLPPVPLAGRSLRPLLDGGELAPRGALLESRLDQRRDADLEGWVDDRWKLVVERDKAGRSGPRRARADAADGAVEPRGRVRRVLLFDRSADPAEQRDVSRDHPDVVAALRATIDDAIAAARDRRPGADTDSTLDLDPVELEALRGLGYLDDEDGEATPAPAEPTAGGG